MPIPEGILAEIKYKNDIEAIISSYVNLKRAGKNLVGLCPFHNEKTPSFTVYPENGSFYCFGCGVGGDVFTFTGLIENLDYIESVKLLAERSGITLPQDGYDDSMQRLKNTIYDINRETAKFYNDYIFSPQGKWGLDYLTGRGLTEETIRHFGLGAAPDSWSELLQHLLKLGYSYGDMMQANVVGKGNSDRYYDRFRHRVMFPIINIRGKIIGFSGRAMPGDDKAGGKYVNTSDTPVYKKSENLFAMNFAKSYCAQSVILVEGNMDVVSLHQAGFQNTVAALGTSFTVEQSKLLARYTKEIILTLDADAAGQKAVKRASEILENSGLSVRVVQIPDGKDPDEFIKKNSPERFRALLDGAISELEFKLNSAKAELDLETDDGRLQYLGRAAEILASVPDIMARDIYISRLSEKYGVSKASLASRVDQLRRTAAKKQKKKEFSAIVSPRYDRGDVNPEKRTNPKAAAAEETLIAVLLRHPDFYAAANEALPPEKLVTALNRRIYKLLLDRLSAGESIDISALGELLPNSEISYLVLLQNGEKGEQNAKTVLKDCIKVILEESMLVTNTSCSEMPVDEWAEQMRLMIANKTKGK